MAGWHHQYNEHKLGQTLGDVVRDRGLACAAVHSVAKSRTQLDDRTTLALKIGWEMVQLHENNWNFHH